MTYLAAVLTGDLIGSTAAEPAQVERTMALLDHHAALVGTSTRTDTRFTRFRGDGWQIVLQHPKDFLWVTVYLTAVLKADRKGCLATRIAIGLGSAEDLGQTTLAAANGSAFVHSGRALDTMAVTGATLALAGEETDDIQRSLLAFVADRMSGWSREQAEVVQLKLTPQTDLTQGDMATRLGISRQAVGARLQAAGFALIHDAGNAFLHHFTPEVV